MESKLENNVLTITLEGEIDHHRARGLRESIDEEIRSALPQTVELDFAEVTFMDSSGIGLIMGRCRLAEDLGARLVVRNPSAHIEKVICLAGLDRIISIQRDKS